MEWKKIHATYKNCLSDVTWSCEYSPQVSSSHLSVTSPSWTPGIVHPCSRHARTVTWGEHLQFLVMVLQTTLLHHGIFFLSFFLLIFSNITYPFFVSNCFSYRYEWKQKLEIRKWGENNWKVTSTSQIFSPLNYIFPKNKEEYSLSFFYVSLLFV